MRYYDLQYLTEPDLWNRYLYRSNEWGRMAWGAPNVMSSLLQAFRVSGDLAYLRRFVSAADFALSRTDQARGIADWAGDSLADWSSTRYTTDKTSRLRHIVHVGLIGLPLLDYCELVRANPSLSGEPFWQERAGRYLDAVRVAVSAHAEAWVSSESDPLQITQPNEGYYRFVRCSPIWCDGINLPFNQQNKMGTLLLKLARLTGEVSYRNQAAHLGRVMIRHLEPDGEGLKWTYWWGKGKEGWARGEGLSCNTVEYAGYKNYDSSGYATMELEFLLALHGDDLCTGPPKLDRFLTTLTNDCWARRTDPPLFELDRRQVAQ